MKFREIWWTNLCPSLKLYDFLDFVCGVVESFENVWFCFLSSCEILTAWDLERLKVWKLFLVFCAQQPLWPHQEDLFVCAFKLSNFQAFKRSNFEKFHTFKLSIFQTLKMCYFTSLRASPCFRNIKFHKIKHSLASKDSRQSFVTALTIAETYVLRRVCNCFPHPKCGLLVFISALRIRHTSKMYLSKRQPFVNYKCSPKLPTMDHDLVFASLAWSLSSLVCCYTRSYVPFKTNPQVHRCINCVVCLSGCC